MALPDKPVVLTVEHGDAVLGVPLMMVDQGHDLKRPSLSAEAEPPAVRPVIDTRELERILMRLAVAVEHLDLEVSRLREGFDRRSVGGRWQRFLEAVHRWFTR